MVPAGERPQRVSDSLAIYLHDHLAASIFAIEVLEFLRDQHLGQSLGDTAAALLAQVKEDRRILEGIIARAAHSVPVMKQASAWMGEKLSEWKLSRGDFGTFEALEALALGMLGKAALWDALAIAAETHARLRGVDFNQLIARAERQHSKTEELRRQWARAAFAPAQRRSA
jgi:hypothetical protein